MSGLKDRVLKLGREGEIEGLAQLIQNQVGFLQYINLYIKMGGVKNFA
jgi:hypothetical protein